MTDEKKQLAIKRQRIIAEIVETEISIARANKADYLRLNYALRKTPEEKNEFTSERLKEVKKELGAYEGDIAAYLREAIIDDNSFTDDNDIITTLCYNFIDGLYYLEELIELDEELLEDEDYIWQARIGGAEEQKKVDKISEFIYVMTLADLFHNLTLFEGIGVPLEEKGIDLKPLPTNKSLFLNGKKLNVSERIMIANAVLDFREKIDALNILDTEKHQLMAYILGNDVSNVRNRINGTRADKVRELEVQEYLKYVLK